MASKKETKINTIEALSAAMQKQFGEPLVELGDGIAQVETISFGIPSLDLETGVGGAPRGRVIEIYGPEGAGKTTILVKLMAQAQKLAGKLPHMTYEWDKEKIKLVKPIAGRVGLIDVENAFDPSLAALHGLKMGKGSGFYFDQPTGGDEALSKLRMMIESNLFDVIGVDSVAGLTTLEQREKDAGDKVIAGTAQLMSSELPKLVPLINSSRTVVVFINQIREKPAVMFGSPETTPGGRALKFYSSMRIRVARGKQIMDGNQQVGHEMKIGIKKNKVAPPFGSTDIDLIYRDYYAGSTLRSAGFDLWADFLKVADGTGVVELHGSSYQWVDKETGEIHKANGKVKWQEYLAANTAVYDKIIAEVLGDDISQQDEQKQ